MIDKSILEEIREVHIAMELIGFNARMQVLESETSLSRRKLLRLYKELKGCSPPKGMLPFSPDWYMAWEHNIHSSMFYNIHRYLQKTECGRPIEITVKAYKLYLEQALVSPEDKPVLGLTRAWTLLRFISCGMMRHIECCICGGSFVTTAEHTRHAFTCSLCCPPSRVMKKNKASSTATELPPAMF